MKYKISIKDQLKGAIFPLDRVAAIIIIAGFLEVILGIVILTVNVDSIVSETSYIYTILVFTLLTIFMAVIPVVEALCNHRLFRFFGGFDGEFEKRFSRGFRFIVIGAIIEFLYLAASGIIGYFFVGYVARAFEPELLAQYSNYLQISLRSLNILIAIIPLYGVLLLVSAMKHYNVVDAPDKKNLEDKMSIKGELKGVFRPFNGVMAVIFVAGFLQVIIGITSLPYLLLALSIISAIIVITETTSRYRIFKFFGDFNGEFEGRLSHGFRIIVTGMIMGLFYSQATIALNYYLYSELSLNYFRILQPIWPIGSILIAIFVLYGTLVLTSSIRFYDVKEV